MEEWRDVPGYEGLYEVSSLGQVRSTARPGTVGGILKAELGKRKKDYYRVSLWKSGANRRLGVHQVLALAFLPNPDNLPIVRHLNDDHLDNRLENLAWGTVADNQQDSVRNGNHKEARKTHCSCGREYDAVYNGRRHCMECDRRRSRERKEKLSGTVHL